MTTAQQWREAAIELRRQAEIFEETARMVESAGSPVLCAVVCPCGPNGEPLACGYGLHHDGAHSWASLPTWVTCEHREHGPHFTNAMEHGVIGRCPGPSPAVAPEASS